MHLLTDLKHFKHALFELIKTDLFLDPHQPNSLIHPTHQCPQLLCRYIPIIVCINLLENLLQLTFWYVLAYHWGRHHELWVLQAWAVVLVDWFENLTDVQVDLSFGQVECVYQALLYLLLVQLAVFVLVQVAKLCHVLAFLCWRQ